MNSFKTFDQNFQKKSRAFPNFEAVIAAAERSLYDLQSKKKVPKDNEQPLNTSKETKGEERIHRGSKMYQVEKSDMCCTFRYQSCCYVS